MFNPSHTPQNYDESEMDNRESPPTREDGLEDTVCLLMDRASMESIIHHHEENPGYVIAIDADSEESEQYVGAEGPEGNEVA